MILLEACAVGAAMYLAVQYVPGMGDTWIGQQLILAIVGIGLAIVLGGGIPFPRFRLPERIAPRFTPCSAASLTNWSRLVPLVTQAASFGASRSSIPNPRGLSGLGCSGSIAKISR